MNNIYKYVLVGTTALLLGSCRNYLDIKPYGKVIPTTPEEYGTLLNSHLKDVDEGVDKDLVGNLSAIIDWEMYGDNFEACLDNDNKNLVVGIVQSLNNRNFAYGKYVKLYEVIRNCNIVIDFYTDSKVNKDLELLSTAYAMRGVAYYQLLRQYCEAPHNIDDQLGLPIVLQMDLEEKTPRSSMRQTIQQIEKDLLTALPHASDKFDEYRFNADVIKGYLARLYFWSKQWKKVIEYSDELLAKYPLLEGKAYTDMVNQVYGLKGNVLMKAPYFEDRTQSNIIQGLNENVKKRPLSKRFLDCFYDEKDKDIRYKSFIHKKRIANKPIYAAMRSAEFMLMKAEAYYHLGNSEKALETINQFRSKRVENAQPFTMDNLPALRENELIKMDADGKQVTPLLSLILTERRKELLLEGDRWFELKRNGSPEFWQAFDGQKYVTYSYMYTFPLPIPDMLLQNDLVQNPGYTSIINQ